MFCSKCGATNNDDAKFCAACGVALNAPSVQATEGEAVAANTAALSDKELGLYLTPEFINSAEFEKMHGEKTDYYRQAFLRIYEVAKQGRFEYGDMRVASGFNLWAGLLTPVWLAYRGVYKWAWFYVFLEALQFGPFTSPMNQLISFVVNMAIVGCFGNYWYYKSLNAKLAVQEEGKSVVASRMADAIVMLIATVTVPYAFYTWLEKMF
jgi:zinc-ribbon domain